MLIKIKKIIIILTIFGSILFLNACGQKNANIDNSETPKTSEQISLSLNLGIPNTHLRYKYVLENWIKTIEEQSGGKVKINPYYANSLSPAQNAYDSTVKGLADITEGIQINNPGKFPLSGVVTLSEIGRLYGYPSVVFWELHKKLPALQDEYKDVKVLSLYVSAPEVIMTSKKPLQMLEDTKGVKIHVNGETKVLMAKELGVSPVSMPYGDVYMAGEKGVINGGVWPAELLQSRKFAEFIEYVNQDTLSYTAFYLIMNKDRWNSLPKDIQKIFENASGKNLAELMDKAQHKFNQEALEWAAKEHSVKIVKFTDDETKKWEAAVKPAITNWIEDMQEKGLPGKEAYELKQNLSETIVYPGSN